MGKGKQDKRKEKRKEDRASNRHSVPSKAKIAGGSAAVSKIEMNEEVEELLIRLMTMLDAGDTEGDLTAVMLNQAALETVDDDDEVVFDEDEKIEGELCSDSDGDDSSDDDSENDDSDRLQNNKVDAVLTDKQRRILVRKLIRDDRHRRINFAAKSYNEKCARKNVINRHLDADGIQSSKERCSMSTSHNASAVAEEVRSGLPVQYREIPNNKGPQVRLTVSCESKKTTGSKLIVVDRTDNLGALVSAVRKKFNVPQKYAELIAMPAGTVLGMDDLFSLYDDTHLVLGLASKVATTSTHGVDVGDVDDEPAVIALETEGAVATVAIGHQVSLSATPIAHDSNKASETLPVPDIAADNTPRTVGDEIECAALLLRQRTLFGASSYQSILAQRKSLPIYRVRDALLAAIRDNQIVVVSGETGSGKTTQLPTYIFEDLIDSGRGAETYIICTQPRRIAAISVAERVAFERQEKVGETVGYHVRLNSRCCASTRIIYCTTGVLLRRLQQEHFLDKVSHIVVDEVHERQVETDFLMTLLKQQAAQHPHLRLIMMSATMQESLFANYFTCPIIYVEGRTFSVEQHYLPDVHKLVAAGQKVVAVARGKIGGDERSGRKGGPGRGLQGHIAAASADADHVRPPRFDAETVAETVIRIIQTYGKRDRLGLARPCPAPTSAVDAEVGADTSTCGDAILVFLSGIRAIDKVSRALRQRNLASMNAFVYTLHGSLPPEQQRRVFKKTSPGTWKIVLSTNIAETSVTLDDVTHVVDCGLVKELRYDPKANMSSLQEVVISRASARQRAGRAGRVRPGHCWRLYTQQYLESAAVENHPTPEIRRVPLEEVVLQLLLLRLGLPEQFLSLCLEPPSMNQIRASVACLLDIKAILPLATLPLTALGYHLAKMPVDVRIGKMLLTASLLGCLEPALTVAAALAGKSPFFNPPNNREEANRAHSAFTSSHSIRVVAANYGVELPELTEDKSRDPRDDLTPPNHAFFSDHLATVNAYDLWSLVKAERGTDASYALCRERFLSHTSLEEMKKLRENFRNHLAEVGFCQHNDSRTAAAGEAPEIDGGHDGLDNDNDDGDEDDERDFADRTASRKLCVESPVLPRSPVYYAAMRCALCAGLYPQIARVSRFEVSSGGVVRSSSTGPQTRIVQGDGVDVNIHPSSLTHKFVKYLLEGGQGLGQGQGSRLRSKDAYLVYHKKVATDRVYLHDCTAVPAAAVLLFGGDLLISRTRKGRSGAGNNSTKARIRDLDLVEVRVGGWICFKMSELHAVLYRRLRDEIDGLMQMKVENPHCDVSKKQAVLLKVLQAIIN